MSPLVDDDADRGMSLVELLIYMFLSVVVLSIVGSILINSLRAEGVVRSSAQSATTAQVATLSLNRGIHNASALELSSPGPGVQVLRSRSLNGASTGAWRCEAWAVVDGQLRWTTSPTAITPPNDRAGAASWTLLVEGVSSSAANPVFTIAPDQRRVAVALEAADGSGIAIDLSTTIISRQPVPATGIESLPCF